MTSLLMSVKPKRIALLLFGITIVLVIISTILGLMIALVSLEDAEGTLLSVFYFFNLDGENNLAAFYGGALWLVAGGISGYIARHYLYQEVRRDASYWGLLASVFIYFALDEWLQIHERLAEPTANFLQFDYFGPFTWVIPGAIAVILLLIVLAPFLKSLPTKLTQYMSLGFIIFLAGAMGVEVFGGWVFAEIGPNSAPYRVLVQLEELLEMTGVIIIIFALLGYARHIIKSNSSENINPSLHSPSSV